ncbi:MAG: glutathione S-transferase N-terminal domain-containing protein [Rhodobacterales bacterium]|nr:glutathione S-transferase N-terminal domain-containing protein [Rhodobacterales bacterium]
MTTFYYSTNSCSLGIRIILEEIGLPYDSVAIDFKSREQFGPAFGAVNPKRKVPALVRPDGSLLTEFQAIAFWLAESYPATSLLATDLEGRIRTMEVMDFIVASVHMRGFTFIIAPMKFSPSPEAQEDLRAHGRAQADLGFARLSESLGDKDWIMGAYSIADAGVFYLCNWALQRSVELPVNLAAHHARMKARPAVQRALAGEGLA